MRRQKSYYYQGRNWRKKKEGFPKRTVLLLLLPIAWGILQLCKHNTKLAEYVFARGVYRWVSIPYSKLMSYIPFSVAEFCLILIPLLVLILLIRFIVRLVRSEQRLLIVGRFLLNIACIVSVVYFYEIILCGVNYYRYNFSVYSGLTVQDSTVQELYEMCLDLAEQANELRAQATKTDDNGNFELTTSNRETGIKARDAFAQLGKEYEVLSGWETIPKAVFFSKYMSYTEITGVYVPFTMEANVDVDISDYSIPSTMCHELAHMRGFMREDEANFLAYLACMASDDVEFQYSGTMLALIQSGNALYRQDKELYQQLRSTYSEGVLADLVANNEYWSQFKDTAISTVTNQVNDTYLKANNQSDGVQSYGRMVDLMLAYWKER